MNAGDPRTPGDIDEGPLVPELPQRRAGDHLPTEERAELLAIREARLGTESCGHIDAHHGIAGDPGHYACDECGTTWAIAAELPARPFEVGDDVLAAGLLDEAMQAGPIIMIHDIAAVDGHEAFCAAYVEVNKSLPETDPKRLVQVLLTADATGPLNDRHRIERLAEPTGALTAPPGVEIAAPPGMTNEVRQRIADDFAALAETGTVAHASSSQAGLASFVPSLVQMDYSEAAARFAATSHAVIMLPAEVDRATQDAAFVAARAALDELEEASR